MMDMRHDMEGSCLHYRVSFHGEARYAGDGMMVSRGGQHD